VHGPLGEGPSNRNTIELAIFFKVVRTVTSQLDPTKTWFRQALSVLCVFLVFFAASVQVTHVHPDSASHDCSICSIAHAGALATDTFESSPVFHRTILDAAPKLIAPSFQHIAAQFIRPPPAV
jgi:hypothetical protein